MTVEEFRNHESLPHQWKKELENNYVLQAVLSVMDEVHPTRLIIPSDNDGDLSPTRAAIELGVTRGYSQYANTLRLLAKAKHKQTEMPEPTYAPVHA